MPEVSESAAKHLESIDSLPPRRPLQSLWIELYSLLLLVLLLGYYALMVLFAGMLLRWSIGLIRYSSSGVAWWSAALAIVCVAALAFFLMRTVRQLIYSSAGLVTTLHDSVPEAAEGIEIRRAAYPRLFALIDEVGEQVGSPPPDEVRVNYPPESFTVELRRFGIVPQRRLILVLSLLQMQILTAAELRVLLAHELSHFGRGDTRLIVFLSRFLASLENSSDSISHSWWHWVDPIYWFQILYYRFFARMSAPVQRHQELRADCISALTYGGELAARTLLKDCLLSHQFVAAVASYQPSDNGTSKDNFFTWFRGKWRDFSPEGQDYLLKRLEAEEQASFWDSDPTISQRVRLMRTFPKKDTASAHFACALLEGLPELEQRLHNMIYSQGSTSN